MPIGSFSHADMQALTNYYRRQYGLQVGVLPGIDLTASDLDPTRGQVSAGALIERMVARYSKVLSGDQVTLIGVTTVDLYSPSIQRWRYVFSLYNAGQKTGVVSLDRMRLDVFGNEVRESQSALRLQKQVNMLVGVMHFGLERDLDPRSAMYDGILSPFDLDRMPADLPVKPR